MIADEVLLKKDVVTWWAVVKVQLVARSTDHLTSLPWFSAEQTVLHQIHCEEPMLQSMVDAYTRDTALLPIQSRV